MKILILRAIALACFDDILNIIKVTRIQNWLQTHHKKKKYFHDIFKLNLKYIKFNYLNNKEL
jgi:hypothetical protein